MSQQKINFLKFLKEKENMEIPPVIILKNKWEGYDNKNIQLAAVQQNGHAIRHIKNPSEQIQLAAVQQRASAIEHIKNPSKQVQLAAVQQYWSAIKYIKNPSEQVQLTAVQQNGEAIQYIIRRGITPSEQVLNDAKESLIRDYELIPSYLEKYFE